MKKSKNNKVLITCPSLLKNQSGINKFIPSIRNSRKTPMAAILLSFGNFLPWHCELSIYRWVAILAEIGQSSDI